MKGNTTTPIRPAPTAALLPLALITFAINRRTMLTREDTVTEVFAPENRARSSP